MSTIAKSLVTVTVTTVFVALLGYFFGFAMLFAHTMSEIFWYGLLFGGTNILALGVVWFFDSSKTVKESALNNVSKTVTSEVATTQSVKKANPAT